MSDPIRRDFDRAARRYDAHALLQKDVAVKLAGRLPAGNLVLDAGCGTGFVAKAAPERRWVGLDTAAAMCVAAEEVHPTVCADMQLLPFSGQTFDGVVSSLALQWLAAPTNFFREAYRVTRPGGWLCLATFGPETLRELREAYLTANLPPAVLTFTEPDELSGMAASADWQNIDIACERSIERTTFRDVSRSLSAIGAAYKRREGGLGLASQWRRVQEAFTATADGDRRSAVTWDVLFLKAWK